MTETTVSDRVRAQTIVFQMATALRGSLQNGCDITVKDFDILIAAITQTYALDRVTRMEAESLRATLQQIALGKRHSNGPIPGKEARELARRVLVGLGYDWDQERQASPSPASPETAATS